MKRLHTNWLPAAGIAFCLVLLLSLGCDPAVPPKDPTNNDEPRAERKDLETGTADPKTVEGGRFKAEPPNFDKRLNEEEKPYIVPDGPQRGKLEPENEAYKPRPIKPEDPNGSGDTQAPLYYHDYDENPNANLAHPVLPEPSVAENGQTIMTTGNNWVSLSLDGGGSFSTVNPNTIFPQDFGGFCCDQVLQYVPEFDLFVWLLQYNQDATGNNILRLAVQTTENVRKSNGTSWTYWDFPRSQFGTSGILDYNDMSFGNTQLYFSTSVGGGANRFVIRIPLEQLRAMGTINYSYTGATQAFWSHVTQGGSDGVYWAGHVNSSTMLVYSMMDADGFYSWREVNINSWPNGTISSIAANGNDWLLDASWKTYVRGAAIQGNTIYFGWNAAAGGGFPRPHVQIVKINKNTFAFEGQMQIWNPDFAFAYPYLSTNRQGELGIIVAFGGGPFEASSGVGVWGDFVIYYPSLSGTSNTNYGHYHTVRRSTSDPSQWVGAGYYTQASGAVVPYYVRFSH